MTPVWLAFLSGVLVGAALGIALHWAEIIGSVRRDRRGCDCHRAGAPCPICSQPRLPLARTLERVEARRLEVPTVRRRR